MLGLLINDFNNSTSIPRKTANDKQESVWFNGWKVASDRVEEENTNYFRFFYTKLYRVESNKIDECISKDWKFKYFALTGL